MRPIAILLGIIGAIPLGAGLISLFSPGDASRSLGIILLWSASPIEAMAVCLLVASESLHRVHSPFDRLAVRVGLLVLFLAVASLAFIWRMPIELAWQSLIEAFEQWI